MPENMALRELLPHELLPEAVPNRAPTRSAVRCTVDSLTRIPLISGNAFDAASEKLLIVPARVVSCVAPSDNRLSSNRIAASRGECPARQSLQ